MEKTATFKKLSVGMLDVNCFLIHVKDSDMLYIIDPGSDADKIIAEAKKFTFKNAEILLTHAHVDHIGAVAEVMLAFGIKKIRLHKSDKDLYGSPENHLLPYIPPARGLPATTGKFDSEDYEVIHTPGHTPGGVCYYFKSLPALFVGDTIFNGSIGRTDFPGGDLNTLIDSIRNKILTLPEDLVLLPGHGPETTVGTESVHNPFL